MEQANNLLMYPTKGPIVQDMVNGRMMNVQLIAASNPEDASKFLAMYEKQQKLQKAGKQESQTGSAKEDTVPEEGKEFSREDSLEQVKKLAEQGYVIAQPVIGPVQWEGKLIDPDRRVVFSPIKEFTDPGVVGLQPVPKPAMEIMSTGDAATMQMQNVQTAVTDDVMEQMVQTPVQVEEVPMEEVQVVEQQVVGEIVPQEQDDDQVEITEVEVAPQQVFHDVKAAPVKVGEAYRAGENETVDVSAQINAQLAEAVANNQSRVQIQLTPVNLGKVTIDIVYSKSGTVQALLLSAERSETRDLLSRSSSVLQGMLSKNGETVQVEVQRQEESQQKNFYDGHNGQGRQQQEQRREKQDREGHDFLQQLRLGLIPVELD